MPVLLEYSSRNVRFGQSRIGRVVGAIVLLVGGGTLLLTLGVRESAAAIPDFPQSLGRVAYPIGILLTCAGLYRLLRVSTCRIDRAYGAWSVRRGWWPFVRSLDGGSGESAAFVVRDRPIAQRAFASFPIVPCVSLYFEGRSGTQTIRVPFRRMYRREAADRAARFLNDMLARRTPHHHRPAAAGVNQTGHRLLDDPRIDDLLRHPPPQFEVLRGVGVASVRARRSRADRVAAWIGCVIGCAFFIGQGMYYGVRILHLILFAPEQYAPLSMEPLTRLGAAAVTIGGMATVAMFFVVLLQIPIRESQWRAGFSIDETCLRYFPIIDLPFSRHTPCIRHEDILRVEARADPARSLYSVESPFDEFGGAGTGASAAREWFCAIMARASELKSPVYVPPSGTAAGPSA